MFMKIGLAMKKIDLAMKIALLLSPIAAGMVLPLPARAGAAGGMPSPFFPPYPDYGCDARCIVRHEAEFRCRAGAALGAARHGPLLDGRMIFCGDPAAGPPVAAYCAILKLPVKPPGENIDRAAVAVVAGIGDELIIGGEPRRG